MTRCKRYGEKRRTLGDYLGEGMCSDAPVAEPHRHARARAGFERAAAALGPARPRLRTRPGSPSSPCSAGPFLEAPPRLTAFALLAALSLSVFVSGPPGSDLEESTPHAQGCQAKPSCSVQENDGTVS